MDLEIVRKSLTKRPALPPKRIAFIALAVLLLAAGGIWRAAYYVNAPQAASPEAASPEAAAPQEASSPQAAPAMSAAKTDLPQPAPSQAEPPTAALPQPAPPPQAASPQAASPQATLPTPSDQGEPASADQAQQATDNSGPILVSKRPVQVLAGPSSTSPALYGFPSGRPFRLIGHQGNFAQIKDLRSGASGWIDETALAELPPSASRSSGSSPSFSGSPSQPRTAAPGQTQGTPRSRAASKGGQITADQQTDSDTDAMPTRRPGLLGGILGGIFGGGN